MFDRRRPSLAPNWLPRRQGRAVDPQLRELWRREVCSACGARFPHNSRVTSGIDARGNVQLAGECCAHLIVETFGLEGRVLDCDYDFLPPSAMADLVRTRAQDHREDSHNQKAHRAGQCAAR
jgi:hypothetical protein